jgi:hypothetical protein
MLSRTVEQAIRLTPNEGDLLTVCEIEAVTQLEAMTFVNRVLPLTLTEESCSARLLGLREWVQLH